MGDSALGSANGIKRPSRTTPRRPRCRAQASASCPRVHVLVRRAASRVARPSIGAPSLTTSHAVRAGGVHQTPRCRTASPVPSDDGCTCSPARRRFCRPAGPRKCSGSRRTTSSGRRSRPQRSARGAVAGDQITSQPQGGSAHQPRRRVRHLGIDVDPAPRRRAPQPAPQVRLDLRWVERGQNLVPGEDAALMVEERSQLSVHTGERGGGRPGSGAAGSSCGRPVRLGTKRRSWRSDQSIRP